MVIPVHDDERGRQDNDEDNEEKDEEIMLNTRIRECNVTAV